MAPKLFVNKFQPCRLSEFELDEKFVQTLHTLKMCDILNIMLIGDAGTGKSSLLDALIKEYYEGYSYSDYKDNVLYINNLKEQGINYYRTDVRIFCQTSSLLRGKKKIIILDDIDLINEQSQQVFRNSIDKFSHNVHFIASCTNIQKVIESIQSRFTIIKINPLDYRCLNTIMDKVVASENLSIDQDARDFVINISSLSVKTMLNYLEKFKLLGEHITLQIADELCTNISMATFDTYIDLLRRSKVVAAIDLLYNLHDTGYSVMDILDSIFTFVKSTSKMTETEKYDTIPIICKYIAVFHNVHEDEIELALFTNSLYAAVNKTDAIGVVIDQ